MPKTPPDQDPDRVWPFGKTLPDGFENRPEPEPEPVKQGEEPATTE